MIFTGFNKAGYDIFTIHNPLELLKDSIILSDASWKNKDNSSFELLRHKDNILSHENQNDNKYKNYIFTNISSNDKEENIEVVDDASLNINFKYNDYPQQWEGFIPNLSIIDVLMNCGPDKTKQLLRI